MGKIKVGFVGVGGMGQCAHLRNYASLTDECEVVAIAEVKEDQAQRVARKFGIQKVYKDHQSMLAAEKLDALVASQPFTRHGVLIPELIASGLPVFTEKPLAGSLEAGKKILDALSKTKSFCMIGYHKRSDPATMWGKAKIEELKQSGALGKLRYVRVLMPAGDWVANGFYDVIWGSDAPPELAWDPAPEGMDQATTEAYFAFVNYYIHQVNILRHLLGEDYKVTYADPSGVVLHAQSTSGVAGIIEMSPYQTTIDWQEEYLVAFENGYVRITLPAPMAINRPGVVEFYKDPGNGVVPERITPQMPWIHAMKQQAMNFIKAVRGDAPPMCDAATAMKDLEVARDYIRLMTGK